MHRKRQRKKNLVYVVAFDRPGEYAYQAMGRMCVSSVLRADRHCKVVLYSNSDRLQFPLGRSRLREVVINTSRISPDQMAPFARSFRVRALSLLDVSRFDQVHCADADCLFMKEIDYLASGPGPLWSEDPYTEAERVRKEIATAIPGMNGNEVQARWHPGVWAVDSCHAPDVADSWERSCLEFQDDAVIDFGSLWSRTIDLSELKCRRFQKGKVRHVLSGDSTLRFYKDATVLHFRGCPLGLKLQHQFGVFMQEFYGEGIWPILQLLDG